MKVWATAVLLNIALLSDWIGLSSYATVQARLVDAEFFQEPICLSLLEASLFKVKLHEKRLALFMILPKESGQGVEVIFQPYLGHHESLHRMAQNSSRPRKVYLAGEVELTGVKNGVNITRFGVASGYVHIRIPPEERVSFWSMEDVHQLEGVRQIFSQISKTKGGFIEPSEIRFVAWAPRAGYLHPLYSRLGSSFNHAVRESLNFLQNELFLLEKSALRGSPSAQVNLSSSTSFASMRGEILKFLDYSEIFKDPQANFGIPPELHGHLVDRQTGIEEWIQRAVRDDQSLSIGELQQFYGLVQDFNGRMADLTRILDTHTALIHLP